MPNQAEFLQHEMDEAADMRFGDGLPAKVRRVADDHFPPASFALSEDAALLEESAKRLDPPIPTTPEKEAEAQQALTRRVLAAAFREPQLTHEELLPYRVKTAWRLVRAMARQYNLMRQDDALEQALAPDGSCIDPWTIPMRWSPDSAPPNYNQIVLGNIQRAESLPPEQQLHIFDLDLGKAMPVPGIPLLPPPVSPQYLDDHGAPIEGYQAEADALLMLYVRSMSALARDLQLDRGSIADPDLGRYGLHGLLDPNTVRQAWPTRWQILTWELLIVEEALEIVIEGGIVKARRRLTEKYGLTTPEATGIVKLAKYAARRAMDSDVDDDRAVMVMRLESFCERAKNSLDLRAELAGLKQISIVLGLARAENADVMGDFISVVKAVSADRKPGLGADTRGILPPAGG